MRSEKEIRERIGELLAQAKALNELVNSEERDFTDEEQAEFDAILAEIGNDGHDGEPKTGLHAQAAKAAKFEGILARNRQQANVTPQIQSGTTEPARPKRFTAGTLKAFKGADAAADAYKCGRWLQAALFNHAASRQWCADHGVAIRAAQTEGDNGKGGYTVPTELESGIITLRERYGVFRREADVVPMGSEIQHHSKWVSGLTAYAVGERATITASDVDLERVELVARKWGILTRVSSELNEDSIINWMDRLANEAAYSFAQKEDECGFLGDGTSTYHGIVGVMSQQTSGVHVKTLTTGDTSFGEIILTDLEEAVGQLPDYAAPNAKWYISRAGFYSSMSRLMTTGGGNNVDDLGSGPGMNFLGYPVVISQALNSTLTAQTDTNLFCFGDLRLAATLGDRRGITFDTSDDVYFTTDETAIKATTRYDIKTHGLTSAAVGPMIIIRTPSS